MKFLDGSLRSPGWLTALVLAVTVGLGIPALVLDMAGVNEGAALAASLFGVLSALIAFNSEPRNTRIVVTVLWLGFALGWVLGGYEDRLISWAIVGLAGLGGSEALSRACTSMRSTATTDHLTGLLNRNGLIYESSRAIALCRRMEKPLSLVHIDLDRFKQVNDRGGHSHGDQILRQCAESWTRTIRASDVLARIGGDEFLLVLPGSDSSDARQLMGLLKEVSPIGWSFGVAELAPGEELQACVDRADAELYTQKGLRKQF